MKIEIDSEERAWEVLSGLLGGKIKIDSLDDIALGDWVKTTVYIPAEKYDSALNTYMMQGWQHA